MTKEIDLTVEAKAQPLSSLISSTAKLYQVRIQAEFLELEFDIDTLLAQLQNLNNLNHIGSAS
jgi:hypothetical protein